MFKNLLGRLTSLWSKPVLPVDATKVTLPETKATEQLSLSLPKIVSKVDQGAELVKYFEGFKKVLPNGLVVPYIAPEGNPTIGYGNRFWENGVEVRLSDKPISRERANELFQFHYNQFKAKVQRLLPEANENEIAAYCSLAYNTGIAKLQHYTTFKAFNRRDKALAKASLEWLCKDVNGRPYKGLQRRRRAERLVMEGYTAQQAITKANKDFP